MKRYLTILLTLCALPVLAQFSNAIKTPPGNGLYNIGRNKNTGIWEEVSSTGQRKALNGVAQHLTITGVRSLSYTATNAPKTVNVTDPRKAGLFIVDATDNSTSDDGAMTLVTSSGVRYKRSGYISLNPKWFGVVGDSVTNDQPGFQAMLDYAKAIKNASIELDPNARYRLGSGVVYDVSSEGQLRNNNRSLILHGNNAKIFLSGATDGYYAFSFIFGSAAEQDAKISIDNLYLYTNNVNRPNGIYANYATFINIDNVTCYQLWRGLKLDNAGMAQVSNCHPFGCYVGFETYKVRDFRFHNCIAFASHKGYFFEGMNDGGAAGALSVDDCKAVACDTNWHLRRLQTARFSKIISDVPNNLGMAVESCNYLQLSDYIGGPHAGSGTKSSIVFSVYPGASNNDYCQLGRIQADNGIVFDHANFTTVTDLTVRGAPSAYDTSAVVISNCYELAASSWKIRDLTSLQNAVKIKATSSRISINGGEFDQKIYFEGAASSRGGHHNLNAAYVGEELKFGAGYGSPRVDETGLYHTSIANVLRTVQDGFIFPRVVMPQVTMTTAGQTTDFDVNTLIPTPDPADAYRLILVSKNGIFGSFGTTTIEVLRNHTSTKTSIVTNIPSSSNTVSIVGDNTIRFTSSINGTTVAKLTLLSAQKIPD